MMRYWCADGCDQSLESKGKPTAWTAHRDGHRQGPEGAFDVGTLSTLATSFTECRKQVEQHKAGQLVPRCLVHKSQTRGSEGLATVLVHHAGIQATEYAGSRAILKGAEIGCKAAACRQTSYQVPCIPRSFCQPHNRVR